METNIWLDTAASGDLWNGRWTEDTLRTLLLHYAETPVTQRDFKKTIKWMQSITALLQKAQRSIYSTRRAELMSLEAKTRRETVIALRRRRSTRRTRTLFAAWKIPYCNPLPRRRQHPPPVIPHPRP